MKTLALGEGVASTVAAQAAVRTRVTPFLSGRDVVGVIDMTGVTGTPTAKIQGSDDGVTYVDLMTSTTLGHKQQTIKAREYMRLNITAAGTGGAVSAYALNGV